MKRKLGLLTPGVKLGPRQLFDMLADTGRGLLNIAVITGLAGVVIGILSLTSLDFSLTFTLLNIAQSSIILLLVLTGIVYIVFGLFALSPALLLIGHWSEVTLSIITALIGAILLGVGLVGYLFRPVGIVRRILFVVAAIGLLAPVVSTGQYAALTWASNGVDALLRRSCSFPSG